MSKGRSHFKNFSTDSLIVLLKQSQKEVDELSLIKEQNDALITRIKDLKIFIKSLKTIIVKRYIESDISLKETSKKILETDKIVSEIFKEVFVLKVTDKEEIIDIGLLEKVINQLSIEQVLTIMNVKKNSIYETLASKRYDEIIFDVEEDVYNDLLLKGKNDELEEVDKYISLNTESPFSIEDTITISKFVNNYLGIFGNCSNLYHSGLKDLKNPYVIGIDNNFANKNPELVYNGYLLLVIDANGNRGTYINPFYLNKLLNKNEVDKELKSYHKRMVIELSELKEYFERFLELSRESEINSEIYNVIKETHKINKFKKLIKERDVENEKY